MPSSLSRRTWSLVFRTYRDVERLLPWAIEIGKAICKLFCHVLAMYPCKVILRMFYFIILMRQTRQRRFAELDYEVNVKYIQLSG